VYTLHTHLPDTPVMRYLAGMDMTLHQPTKWSDRLALDVALALEGSGEPLDEIKQRHNISASEMVMFTKDPIFLNRVQTYRTDVREKGLTFKLKARAQAEELLTTSWTLIHDAAVSPAVKADLIKSTVKWAGLEAKIEENGGNAGGVKININFGGNTPPMTVTADLDAEAIEFYEDSL
jgi:hypothetical protein